MEPWRAELYHHGIKGQRWGVRRGPPYPLGEGRRRRNTPKSSGKPVGMVDNRVELNTKVDSFTLKKGTTLHRLSTIPNEKNEGRTYATFKASDTKRYMRRSLLFRQKSFDMTMRATEDLVSPSRKQRVDIFIQLLQENPEFLRDLASASAKFSVFSDPKKIEEQYRKMTEAELRVRAYNDLSLQIGFDDKVREQYFSALSKRGYNMIIDDADAQLLSDSPVIIFERAKSLEVISVDPVTWSHLKTIGKTGAP